MSLDPRHLFTLLAILVISACRSGASSDITDTNDIGDDSDTPVAGYRIHYTVEGLEGSGADLYITLSHSEIGIEEHAIPMTGNDSFVTDFVVQAGWHYGFRVDRPRNPDQHCVVENGIGRVGDGDVTGVRVICRSGYRIHYSVDGLAGSGGKISFVLTHSGFAVEEHLVPMTGNDAFVTEFIVQSGWQYNVFVNEPDDPEQTCTVENSIGLIGNEDVTGVRVVCDAYRIHYTVEGLEGSGADIHVALSHKEFGIDRRVMDMTEDGDFFTEFFVLPGWNYHISVDRPKDPDQHCVVENGVGRVGNADVTGVRIICRRGYRIHYTVDGLAGGEGRISFFLTHPGIAIEEHFEPMTENGSFVTKFVVQSGWQYQVSVDEPDDPEQTCTVENSRGLIGSEDVTNVRVDCSPAVTLTAVLTGLRGGSVTLSNTITDDFAVDPSRYPINDEITFTQDGEQRFAVRLKSGESYDVNVEAQPENPAQYCAVREPRGTVFGLTPPRVDVECGEFSVGYEVEAMAGSGLEVVLWVQKFNEDLGIPTLLLLETDTVNSDGEYSFDTLLPAGAEYQVDVHSHPTNPDQDCIIENFEGTISGDVTDVLVLCAKGLREYRFDTTLTRETELPLAEGELPTGEVLDAGILYGMRAAVPLGVLSGFDGEELFRLHLDDPEVSGIVHSNATGFTYWLAAESPAGPEAVFGYPPRGSHWARLDTHWRFEKESPEAKFQLVISKVHALIYFDTAGGTFNEGSNMQATADVAVRAYIVNSEQVLGRPIYNIRGIATLTGTNDAGTINWQVDAGTLADVDVDLWSVPQFTIEEVGQVVPRNQVALMKLTAPITVDVDLSQVPEGFEVLVVSTAQVRANNTVSQEGLSAVFFRDPGEVDPGEPEGGITVTDTTGLRMIDIGDLDLSGLSEGGGAPAAACDASAGRDVLEFEALDYRVAESADFSPASAIRITRSGTAEGLVTARVSLAGVSADAGDDFDATELEVRFGDGSSAPRTLVVPIVDDAREEGDESFTVTLHSPEGCATIGARNTATVTILANDPAAGTLAFSSDAWEVAESAGAATVTVERTGGTTGILAATLETADGTATAGVDYAAVSAPVVFQDGDAAPKSVQIPILDNAVPQTDRTLSLSLASADPAVIGAPANALLTIRDDDVPFAGTLQFGQASYTVAEAAGAVTTTVTRSGSAAGAVSVMLATADGGATSPADYQGLQAIVAFADGDDAPKSVNIAIVDDGEDEGDHAFSLMLFDPTGGAELGAQAVVPVVIVDDDGAPPPLPGAPVLGVSAEPKQLVFDWATVPEASYYRLLMNPTGTGGFAQVGGDIPLGETNLYLPLSVHLVDWPNTQFLLRACNSAGCRDSNVVGVDALMRAAIGFFKASNTEGAQQRAPFGGDFFGWALAVSGDGRTLAVTAYNEDSGALFLNGDQGDNSRRDSGAVYLFTDDGSGWFQQAYVKAPNTDSLDRFGTSLALSDDGSTLAIGAPAEASSATGVGGDRGDNASAEAGAVYVYARTGSVWALQAYVKASNTGTRDQFGAALALSDDGNVLLVGAPNESSGATGIAGNQSDDTATGAGAAYLFERSNGSWSQRAYVKASNTEAGDAFGTRVAISGDASTLAVTAQREDSAARGINGDQGDNSATGTGSPFAGTGAVYVYASTNGVVSQQAYVKSSNLDADDRFGSALALSRDGALLAVGAEFEDGRGTGVNSAQEPDNSLQNPGAVYLYSRSGALWQQDAYVKSSNPGANHRFGRAVDLSADGRYLVVGADGEDSRAVGINGDQSQSLNVDIGAAYLFRRDAAGDDWAQSAYVKASNSDLDRFGFGRELAFGYALALSDDGALLAIGGHRDGSIATGINGDQANEDALQSGAVYVY